MKKFLRIGVFLSFILFSLYSCVQKKSIETSNVNDQVLVYGNQSEPEDLDPHIITGNAEMVIINSLLEGLVVLDPKNLDPLPGAAKTWERSNDQLVYTFHLRPEGKWSNGDPVRASDFVYSYKRILTPSLASEYAYMLFVVKNAESYFKGKESDFAKVGLKAVDDMTLQITLDHPVPYFLSLIAHTSWFPVHPATIEKFGASATRGTKWTQPGNFVGNGAFTLTKWEINKEIEVTRRSTYWDAANVKLRAVRFLPIESQQTEERNFRTGALHITTNCPLDKIDWYRANDPSSLRIDPYYGTYFYLVNIQNKALKDPRVRRALAYAIDRKTLVEKVLKGGQMPAVSFTPPVQDGYTCETTIGFDTVKARQLLEEAGYTKAHPLPSVSLLYNTSESHQTIAQAIQQMWKQYLGIDVTLMNQEWKVYLASTHSKNYELARMGWTADYFDPTTFLDMWITDGGNNRTGWSNASYDSLITQAARQSDQPSRFALFQKAEKILLDEMPILPIYFYTNVYLISKSVQGWTPNVLNYHPFKFVSLK